MKVKVMATINETFTFDIDVPEPTDIKEIICLCQDEANTQSDEQVFVPRILILNTDTGNMLYNGH